MAVAFLFEAKGAGGAEYDEVMRGIGRGELNSPEPDGIISHIAGPTASGWRVVDVWESEEQAGRFYGSPDFQKAVGRAAADAAGQLEAAPPRVVQGGQKLRLTSVEWPSGGAPPPGHPGDYLPTGVSSSAKATS